MTTPVPRTIRAARLLAAALIPLVALPAIGGLVVCFGAEGPAVSWGERPCPKRQAALPMASADDATVAPCVIVPDGDDALASAAPDLRVLSTPAFVLVGIPTPRPAEAPVALASGPRGPPTGALRALRTVVLRV